MISGFGRDAAAQAGPDSAAGPPPPTATELADSGKVVIYLMTMGAGREVWERFGHDALWVVDSSAGTSTAYNYGMFDFAQKDFLLRFVRGKMWYWMQGFDAMATIDFYIRQNRTLWVQHLNLTGRQRIALRDFLRWNELPANRFYHYDYYRDNCATRVRDAIDRVIGGAIRRQTDTIPTGTTYRFHTQRLTAAEPLLYTGLLAALGQPVDRPLTAWQEMFLPLELHKWIKRVTVPGPDGGVAPLVGREEVLYSSTDLPPPDAPPYWLPWYLAIGVTLGGALLLLGRASAASPRARTIFAIAGGAWALLTALTGVILTGLWTLTDHTATYRNENLFLFNVLALVLVVAVPRLGLRGRAGRWALPSSAAVAAVAVLGLAVKVLPGFYQHNGELLALAVPAHLGLLAGIRLAQRAP